MQSSDDFFDKYKKLLNKKGINIDPKSIESDRDKRQHEADVSATKAFMQRDRVATFKSSLIGDTERLKQTFDDFEVTNDEQESELEQAKIIAKRILQGEKHKFIFTGKPGNGKTTLAIAVLNECKKDFSCLFISFSKFIAMSRDAINDDRQRDSLNRLNKAINRAQILVLDDLGSESSMGNRTTEASNYTQKILFNIAESRDGKTTIITTNNTGQEFKSIYDRKLVSKLLNTKAENVIQFDSGDYRINEN